MPNDGPRWIEVSPERFPGWVAGFAERHGPLAIEAGPEVVTFRGADGAAAACHPPFPPLGAAAGAAPPGSARAVAQQSRVLARHAAADRTVGVLLVRLGGYAAGVFTGAPPVLAASKVGSRLVHGRSAAGGQSQQRFARRRVNQAGQALAAAADTAARVFGGYPGALDVVVLGGDRRAMATLRTDPRLAGYFARADARFLTVPDPRLKVLQDTPRRFRAIRIQLAGPAGDPPALGDPPVLGDPPAPVPGPAPGAGGPDKQ
jgi:Actinobacteria/chloroflexi VLRF1 release factor